jgi:hypothetical protein
MAFNDLNDCRVFLDKLIIIQMTKLNMFMITVGAIFLKTTNTMLLHRFIMQHFCWHKGCLIKILARLLAVLTGVIGLPESTKVTVRRVS